MTPGPFDPETRRVRQELAERLQARGIETAHADSAEDLARIVEAVEEFERTVERQGGDLMVDEPVTADAGRPIDPDNQLFVLPARGDEETASAFIERIAEARYRASRSRRRS